MKDVPISFEDKGETYKGTFNPISGGGAGVWHLMIGGYYIGALQLTQNYGWAFHGNKFQDMSEYFGNYITLWYE